MSKQRTQILCNGSHRTCRNFRGHKIVSPMPISNSRRKKCPTTMVVLATRNPQHTYCDHSTSTVAIIALALLVNKLCATCTSLILTKPHPISGYDAGNQPPAPDLEARRSVVGGPTCRMHEAQTFRNGPDVRSRNRPSRVRDSVPTACS